MAAYTALAIAAYGAVASNFRSLDHALLSVTGLLTRFYDFPEMKHDDLGWGLFCIALIASAWISLTGYVSSLKHTSCLAVSH